MLDLNLKEKLDLEFKFALRTDDPSTGTFQFPENTCEPGKFQIIRQNGLIECYECEKWKTGEQLDFNVVSYATEKQHGGCCVNSHHSVCRTMMDEYVQHCEDSEWGNYIRAFD